MANHKDCMRIAIFYSDSASMRQLNDCLEAFQRQFPTLIDRRILAPAHRLRRTVEQETFDLVVLAAERSSSRLFALASWLKGAPDNAPYTLLTLDDSDLDATLAALRIGIDDFLSLPLRQDHFRARLLRYCGRHKPLMTHCHPPAIGPDTLRCGNLCIDMTASRVYRDGQPVTLTHQELRLAMLFLRNIGRQISRAYIYESIWGREEHPLSRSLDVHIHRLRKKLKLVEKEGWSLDSVYGFGYLLRRLERNPPTKVEPPKEAILP